MTDAILRDSESAPNVFDWNGPVDRHRIQEWLADRGWMVPADLIDC